MLIIPPWREVVFYEDKTLHRFNLKSGSLETLNEDIKLEKIKDYTANLQVRPDGYLVSVFLVG